MNIIDIQPFKSLSEEGQDLLLSSVEYKYYPIGERISRKDELPYNVHLIIKGEVRILVQSLNENSLVTLEEKVLDRSLVWSDY